uniref:WAP four-disulfide core domain protein 12 n=1 Tax=Lemur catta TaxID=9447 RepID=WFD12_LEMCA|nr:RecName: Full=WAP four-disulfide core domain protein 12; Flags: Precursor [Lemur catta]ABO52959.1 WAP four-disulfide core domain 12 precursor [Lemur catta]
MRSYSFWFLTAFLVFATLALGEAVKGGKEKWGNCPAEKGSCIKSGPSQCHADNDCPGDKKCCFLSCSFKCVSPDRIRKEGGNEDEDVSRSSPEPGGEPRPPGSSPSTSILSYYAVSFPPPGIGQMAPVPQGAESWNVGQEASPQKEWS